MSGDLLVTEIAYLASGRWAAVRVGLVMLLRRGLLKSNRRRQVERAGSSPKDGEPMEKALFAALLGWVGAREVGNRSRVRAAGTDLRRGLERRGLLRRAEVRIVMPLAGVLVPGVLVARLVTWDVISPAAGVPLVLAGALAGTWWLPRRTVAGARELRRLRAEYAGDVAALDAGTADAGEWPVRRVGVIVALHGDRALAAIMPAAGRAGLVDGGRWSRDLGRPDNEDYGPWTAAAADNNSTP